MNYSYLYFAEASAQVLLGLNLPQLVWPLLYNEVFQVVVSTCWIYRGDTARRSTRPNGQKTCPILLCEIVMYRHTRWNCIPIGNGRLKLCCTCRLRDRGAVSVVYAAALATSSVLKECRPIDRPRVATSFPSSTTGRTSLGQEGAIRLAR